MLWYILDNLSTVYVSIVSSANCSNPFQFSQHGRGNIWSKKNPGVLERASKDLEKKQEEEDVMERSRCVWLCACDVYIITVMYMYVYDTYHGLQICRKTAFLAQNKSLRIM